MCVQTHFPIVPFSKHLNFAASSGFPFGGEPQVSRATGGVETAVLQLGCSEEPSGTIVEPPMKSVSWSGGVSLQALDVHCTSHCSAVCSTWM